MERRWNALTDMPNLLGKVGVVTGAGNGIVLETTRLLASRGAKARDKLQATHADANSQNIEWLQLDLADLRSATVTVDELKRRTARIDILLNNAGIGTSSTDLVAGRWSSIWPSSYLAGPFLFVNRIMPLLETAAKEGAADVRIVNISSIAHRDMLPTRFEFPFESPYFLSKPVLQYPWQWSSLGKFMFSFDMVRYAVSKAGVVLFTRELQRRLDALGLPILSISVHPGGVATEGAMATNGALFKAVARLCFLSPEQGAMAPLFAAVAAEVRLESEKYKGKFLVPIGKAETPNPVVEDEGQAKGLWVNMTAEVNRALLVEDLPPLEEWWHRDRDFMLRLSLGLLTRD
ncbi:hypothetical protein EDB81DRAFT_836280 [Dactylonectria macrodidyma]|uniref:Uncharacterized protein n=1 Tax=Dactylonectria macrodidyma TaxID=307937 RepID=A0A9P9FTE9_9HYPO|nr:hypothetical protein EDB81DRAFT_836280 [Dactylonectria macrodidyma]